MNFIIFFLLSCYTAEIKRDFETSFFDGKELIYIKNDSPEIYDYPTDSSYVKNDFKVRSLSIKKTDVDYIVCIEMENKFRGNLASNKKINIHNFDIYLFTDNGKHNQSLAGRRVKFNDKWEKMILLSPRNRDSLQQEILEYNTSVWDKESDIENLREDIYLANSFHVHGNKIYISIPRSLGGVIENINGLQLLVTAYESYPKTTNFGRVGISVKEVLNEEDPNNFSGGTLFGHHPNVMSILGDINSILNFEDSNRAIFVSINKIPVKIER
jgi:hypothetical protein